METINIAGVSCRVDKLANLTYESIYSSAIGSMHWKGVKGASELIDKELRENGFKPVTKNAKSAKKPKQVKDRADDGGRTAKKRRTDRRTGKK